MPRKVRSSASRRSTDGRGGSTGRVTIESTLEHYGVALRVMYTRVSDLATCCADSWRNEPLLTRSSPSS